MSSADKAGGLLAQLPKGKGPAPVHLWNPDFCGDIDMRIARDGSWYYLGTPIGRKAMVKLFSNIIRRDGDDYFLVTPVEKVGIKVDDAPFVAVELRVEGQGQEQQQLTFITNVEEQVLADEQHAIRVQIDPQSQEPAPYLLVRNNLEALIARSVFYQLVELAQCVEVDGVECLGVWSAGQFFVLGDLL